MRYTLLTKDASGVLLQPWHARRLAPEGPRVLDAFARFCLDAQAGTWAVSAENGGISVEPRGPSRLSDGMPARWMVSPFSTEAGGWFPKPRAPSAYDGVRVAGISTLLTSEDGTEILESCSAAVLAWDEGWVCVPSDRPRVHSVAEQAIRDSLDVREAPLHRDSTLPLVLVNAVKGVCTLSVDGRGEVPPHAVIGLRERLTTSSSGTGPATRS